MNKNIDFSNYFSSPELLATEVLKEYKNEMGILNFPINPFQILKKLDVKLVFKNFNKLEGIFLPSNEEEDIDLVAININRPIYRQRFTAAHEICHCIKDKGKAITCPISGKKNKIEKFADSFAAALLMPITELEKQVDKYLNKNGYIDLENVINVSEYFGVSFESCVYRIAYNLKKIDGNTDIKILKKRIKKINVDKLRRKYGIKNLLKLKRDLIDEYCYTKFDKDKASFLKFKQYLFLNENKLEGIEIEAEEINFILADLRLNKDPLKYVKKGNSNILEALGDIELIEYVLTTNDKLEIWKLQKMQSILYKYTPYGDQLEFPRRNNNSIKGSEISTVDYKLIVNKLIELGEKINSLINNKNTLKIHEYILEAIKIHHAITVIHPLNDGNGRCSRAMLLWLLRAKNIPPFYISVEDKEEYIKALNKIDVEDNYDYLELLVLEQIIKNVVLIEDKLY